MVDKINLSTIREIFGRVAYTHKTHEKETELCRSASKRVKWCSVVIIAVTSTSILSDLFFNCSWLPYLSSIFATLSLGITVYRLNFNSEEEAVKHKQIAKELLALRERLVALITDISNEFLDSPAIVKKRDEIIRELELIYKFAPSTGSEAYMMAQKALQKDEELTFSNQEIDNMLPKELRISENKS